MTHTKELTAQNESLASIDNETLFSLVTNGDCSKLSDNQKLQYYKARCDAAGLDPRAQPFQFISLSGKMVLYALKGCTDQLAAKHGIVCEVLDQRTEEGIRTVTVRARAKDGRQTDEIGCVNVQGLKGDAVCNAFMKAVTKAKRRATLSICGLGVLDETELETIPGAALPSAESRKASSTLPIHPPLTPPKKQALPTLSTPTQWPHDAGLIGPGETILTEHMTCECGSAEWTYLVSKTEKNPNRPYLKCSNKSCTTGPGNKPAFRWWDDADRKHNLSALFAGAQVLITEEPTLDESGASDSE